MDDRRTSRRRFSPVVEGLDARLLMAARPVTGLGQYIEPGVVTPRTRGNPVVLDAVPSLNRYLTPLLGEEQITQIKDQAAARKAQQSAQIAQRVVSQPFIRTVLGNYDTYQLLNSQAMQLLVGYTQASSTSATPNTVRYILERENLAVGGDTTRVEVPASGGLNGFFAEVPTSGVRPREDGFYNVDIPVELIPANAPTPQTITLLSGELSTAYAATGPLLAQSLLTGQHRRGPNTPQVVRGLRMARYLANPRLFPNNLQGQYLRLMRVAVERNAFAPTAEQAAGIAAGLDAFIEEVALLQAQGEFTPEVPPATPPDPVAGPPLNGTLVVSAGAVRDLYNVAPGIDGLPLLGLNFPGRLDTGFVIAPNGDYGLILTARGPLQDAPAGYNSDLIGGDVRVEVSDAPNLAALGGLRLEEGTFVGTVLSGAISASRTPGGSRILGASAGYGTGLEFGTGYAYTKVIPLGNLNALIPQYPRAG
jgi:hypothetical protein